MKCYGFVHAEKANHSISILCRVVGVARAGYYAWLGRGPSARAREDERLTAEIAEIHSHSRGTYGTPRVHAALIGRGSRVARKRVARLMAEAGLSGARRPRRVHTTVVDDAATPAPNLVDRHSNSPWPHWTWPWPAGARRAGRFGTTLTRAASTRPTRSRRP